jgi:thiamine biosynthesis lipoprotein
MQVRIVLYAAEEYEARQAAGAAFAEIARLDAVFSDYRNDSELSRLVDRAGQAPVPVTQELYEVLGRGQHLARQTGGAFDITAGALTRLWRAAIRDGKVPDEAARRAAMAASGSDWLRLDGRSQTAQVTGAGVRLDLGGIAKGYVIDRALRTLGVHGVTRALVQAGGDIVVGAAPGGEVGWRLTIPYAACEVVVADAAISTSGDTEQFVEVEGKRYSHTVDPRSGFGLTQRRIATVVATDGIAADSLATAITILEDKEVEALLHLYPGARALVGHLRPLGGSSEPKLYNLQIYEEPATSHVPNAPGVFAACRRQARR